jgi:transposase
VAQASRPHRVWASGLHRRDLDHHHGNLGSQKARAVRQSIRIAGAKLFFLPKHSPELNLIEQIPANSNTRCARSPHALSKLSAPQLPPSSPRKLFPKFTPCVNPIAVMQAAKAWSRAINSAWTRARNTLREKQSDWASRAIFQLRFDWGEAILWSIEKILESIER